MKLQDIVEQQLVLSLEDLKDSELLKQIQIRLADLSLYPQTMIDGVWGPRTKTAIKEFCESVHLDNYASKVFGSSFAEKLIEAKAIKQSFADANDHIQLILRECHRQGVLGFAQIAYILATVQHETANTFKPIDEYGGRQTRYAPYWGRGYVQLTWRENYAKYSKLTGIDLVTNPHLAKEPTTAAFILVHGFRSGTFTGKKISDYVGTDKCDFRNARRCINGLDKCERIASLAQQWLRKVKALM